MHIIIAGLLVLALVFGPQLWVQWVLRRYSAPHERFPGTGGELARHLLDRYELQHVKVETTELGDHYDPEGKTVRLTADKHNGKSLTAIAVAAHEVGHALQDHTGYAPLRLRSRLAHLAIWSQKAGAAAMFLIPVLAMVTRAPSSGVLMFVAGLLSLGTGVLLHLATLPTELDASFKRALPILIKGEYITADEAPAVRRILRAAAFTYVAASLASLLNLARWLAILRR